MPGIPAVLITVHILCWFSPWFLAMRNTLVFFKRFDGSGTVDFEGGFPFGLQTVEWYVAPAIGVMLFPSLWRLVFDKAKNICCKCCADDNMFALAVAGLFAGVVAAGCGVLVWFTVKPVSEQLTTVSNDDKHPLLPSLDELCAPAAAAFGFFFISMVASLQIGPEAEPLNRAPFTTPIFLQACATFAGGFFFLHDSDPAWKAQMAFFPYACFFLIALYLWMDPSNEPKSAAAIDSDVEYVRRWAIVLLSVPVLHNTARLFYFCVTANAATTGWFCNANVTSFLLWLSIPLGVLWLLHPPKYDNEPDQLHIPRADEDPVDNAAPESKSIDVNVRPSAGRSYGAVDDAPHRR